MNEFTKHCQPNLLLVHSLSYYGEFCIFWYIRLCNLLLSWDNQVLDEKLHSKWLQHCESTMSEIFFYEG